MSRTRASAVLIPAVLAACSVASAATHEPPVVRFTSTAAGASTGLHVQAKFDGTRLVDQLTLALPRGTRFDTAAAPLCKAEISSSHEEGSAIAAQGGYGKLCPGKTKLGSGEGSAIVNGTPTTFKLDFYNYSSGLFVDLKLGDTAAFISLFDVRANTLVFDLSTAPQLKAKLTSVEFTIRRSGTTKKPWLRGPARCPSSHELSAAIKARAAGKTTTDQATVRCSKAKG